MKPTTIKTKRFTLRAYRSADAASLQRSINDPGIARNTLHIPHPYTLKDARDWIRSCQQDRRKKQPLKIAWAIDINGEVAGGVGLHFVRSDHKAEIGYWLGRKYWGSGFMTEAAKHIIALGFKQLRLKRLYAFTFSWNKASGRVLEKNGFKQEGLLRKNVKKGSLYVDTYLWAKVR
ncbi:MAG: GNAT family N-acetyltransferase [Patescibacteria group bacterium]